MIKTSIKNIYLVLLLLSLVLNNSVIISAESNQISIEDKKIINFNKNDTKRQNDLFDKYKNVMPGDNIEDEIVIYNNSKEYDYVNIYIVVKETDNQNPLVDEFLNNVTLQVFKDEKYLFNGITNKLINSEEVIYLGKIKKDGKILLTTKLIVPIDLGNEYTNIMGLVKWRFIVEGMNESSIIVDKEIIELEDTPGLDESPNTGVKLDNVFNYILFIVISSTILIYLKNKRLSNN